MNSLILKLCCTILCACLLTACAPREGKLAPITPFCSMSAAEAQFTARVSQAPDLPLQGGVVLHPHGGKLGLITSHGRTLGTCTFSPEMLATPDGEDAVNTGYMFWSCQSAPGMESAACLLNRVVPAVYAGLCQGLQGQRMLPKEPSSALQPFRYEDSLGSVEIIFTEIVWP